MCVEELRDLFLVSFELLNGRENTDLLRYRALALNHSNGNAVNKNDNIRPAGFLWTFHRELIHCQKLIFVRVFKIDETNRELLPSGSNILVDGDTGDQLLMEFIPLEITVLQALELLNGGLLREGIFVEDRLHLASSLLFFPLPLRERGGGILQGPPHFTG